MPLVAVDISISDSNVPQDVDDFLRQANLRISRFLSNAPCPAAGFVPSDYLSVYRALRAISGELAPAGLLCEWGSGFGVVTCLATMLNLRGYGIEIEDVLVESARKLASDFGLPAEFVHGSFVPIGCEPHSAEAFEDTNGEYAWLMQDADDGYKKLGRAINAFDIIFAYPWPGEEYLIEHVFEKHAAPGAMLLMYSDILALTVQRKVKTLSTVTHPSYRNERLR